MAVNGATSRDTPHVFVSYSHDSVEHADWVLKLASRLVTNGVNVELDQWNTPLGSDLQTFMEQAAARTPRVIAVVSEEYKRKADNRSGGVGVEKNILSSRVMSDPSNPAIIPLIRNNPEKDLPLFLLNTKYINFNDDTKFEDKYIELIYDIYGENVRPKPPLGESPFDEKAIPPFLAIQRSGGKYFQPDLIGSVEFDYTNNNGVYTIGSGMNSFQTRWSGHSVRSVHAYNDGDGIEAIALAELVNDPSELQSLSKYDFSSRIRSPEIGDSVIWLNSHGRFALTRIDSVFVSHSRPRQTELVFSYWLDIEDLGEPNMDP